MGKKVEEAVRTQKWKTIGVSVRNL